MKNFSWIFLFVAFACSTSEVTLPEPVLPVPSQVQLDWQEKELFAFIHFTVNTFTDKEWGFGDENPNVFNPEELGPEQWVKLLKETGFEGAILTAKHHDGFCLWPSRFTEHSVKNSSWRDGKGDVVGDLKKACDKYELPMGIYLSPWDRNHAGYSNPEYVQYYQNQLNELLKNYGPVFEIWFDGANGGDGYYGGANETRKIDDQVYYQWDETFKIVKDHNPQTLLRGDARHLLCESRWCGNESGYIGETNWNMVTPDTILAMGGKRTIGLNSGDINGTHWMPAEVDVSIRPGWFYHEDEDSLVKTPDELFEIYLKSIGRGAPLLLNITPNKQGLIPEMDVESLRLWKKKIDETFAVDLASRGKISVDSYRGESKQFNANNLIDDNKETSWATDDGVINGVIQLDFDESRLIQYIVLQEHIKLGQRIKSYNVEVMQDGQWKQVAEGTTIGFKRIIPIPPTKTKHLRINITDSRACLVVNNLELY